MNSPNVSVQIVIENDEPATRFLLELPEYKGHVHIIKEEHVDKIISDLQKLRKLQKDGKVV